MLAFFLLCSFQLVCAALLLRNCSFTMSLPTESLQADQLEAAYSRSSFQQPSLQPEELVTAYSRSSFQQHSLQQDELAAAYFQSPTRARQLDSFEQMELLRIESFIHQLDLGNSLSLSWLSLLRCSRSSFEQRALTCAALLYKPRIRNRSVQSFHLTRVQRSSLVQGGAFNPTLQTRASSPPLHCTASTLTSLSLALDAWLKPSSKRAWRRSALRRSLFTTLFANNFFQQSSFKDSFSNNIFQNNK